MEVKGREYIRGNIIFEMGGGLVMVVWAGGVGVWAWSYKGGVGCFIFGLGGSIIVGSVCFVVEIHKDQFRN